MILDNEQQRQFLLELIKQVQFPGQVLDVAYAVKQAVQTAELMPQSKSVAESPRGLPALGQQSVN